jgi:translocation and assembly module TamB
MVLGRIRAEDVLAARPGRPPQWSASAEIDVEHLELAPIPLPTRMRGALTGRAKLNDLGGTPSIEAHAHVDRFAVSGARVEAVDASLGARDGSLFASARSSERGASTLEVTVASRAFRWKGVVPGWDANELTRVDYVASGLRLALLRPFARQAIADLDGRLDGRGSAMFDASSQTFEGGLALSEGRVYVRSLGEDVTDVKGIARFERSGIFRIDDATGRVDQGEFRASATGRMKGLSFVGANVTIIVPSKNGIPLSSEGVSYAEATGEVRLEARMTDDRKALLVTVDVPRAELDLPQREAPKLQPLAPDKTIELGIRRPNGHLDPILEGPRRRRATTTTEESITTRFTVVLGDQVTLEGQGLNVQLGGRTIVDVAEEVKVTGRIELRGGSIEVHGRRFTVDRGSVTFSEGEDPSNPTVVAAAYWDAPDRTRIWVEFAGPLKSGTLTLRSEPAYSKNEILSILLFGRPDPNMAAAGQKPTEAGQATAIGTGFVATDVNRALAELDEDLQVETDTLSGNRTRTKVGYRVARNLRLQVGYAPGQSYREPDTTFAFLDWQFLPKWSLLATQGNRGTSILDVLFQHRY